ncbi:hypothetical protein Cadr_000005942 [Camelus dromedarius]|uniref:Uncharacterized protein n=1 Tax=Camelus dromedarius TaxID=9838 RepID=A0A5N4E3W7_CAMDR|nr:hypothetical protein Cadr_000005942 [Camelus dromedarius]
MLTGKGKERLRNQAPSLEITGANDYSAVLASTWQPRHSPTQDLARLAAHESGFEARGRRGPPGYPEGYGKMPSQIHRRTAVRGLRRNIRPVSFPPCGHGLCLLHSPHEPGYLSATTARRSMVLKRVFMARFEGRYRSFLHYLPDSTPLLLCAGALGVSTAAQNAQYSLKRTLAIHRRDPTTDQHGSFDLLRFRPGPVHPSLGNLVVPRSRECGHPIGIAHYSPELLGSSDPPASASRVAGTTGARHRARQGTRRA